MGTVYWVVSIFLLATLLLGFFQCRKVRSFQDYAFGSGKLHTGILAIPFIATFVGAGDLVIPHDVYDLGIIINTEVLGYILVFCFFGYFLSKKLEKLSHCHTMGDLMGQTSNTFSSGEASGLN